MFHKLTRKTFSSSFSVGTPSTLPRAGKSRTVIGNTLAGTWGHLFFFFSPSITTAVVTQNKGPGIQPRRTASRPKNKESGADEVFILFLWVEERRKRLLSRRISRAQYRNGLLDSGATWYLLSAALEHPTFLDIDGSRDSERDRATSPQSRPRRY